MRKVTGIILLLAFMLLWAIVASALGAKLTGSPRWLQLVFYIIAGLGWVIPLRPLFRWMNAKDVPPQD